MFSCSIVSDKPFADVYKVEGIRGFYIASQFLNSTFSLYNQASLVSYDKGAPWTDIVAPSIDADGDATGCTSLSYWVRMYRSERGIGGLESIEYE